MWGLFQILSVIIAFIVSAYILFSDPDPDMKLSAGVFLGLIVLFVVVQLSKRQK